MSVEPVAAASVLGSPGERQLAEAEPGDKHIGLADFPSGQLDPLTRLHIARGDRRLPILREFAVELLPEVGVRGERLRLLLPKGTSTDGPGRARG